MWRKVKFLFMQALKLDKINKMDKNTNKKTGIAILLTLLCCTFLIFTACQSVPTPGKAIPAPQVDSVEVDDETAVSIGHLIGAAFVIAGSISRMESARYLRIRVLDVQTGQIQAMTSISYGGGL